MFGLGCINATGLAYRRIIQTENPAIAPQELRIRYSFTDWRVALACRPDQARLSSAPTALAGAGEIGGFRQLEVGHGYMAV
jgi:hypothetical protein